MSDHGYFGEGGERGKGHVYRPVYRCNTAGEEVRWLHWAIHNALEYRLIYFNGSEVGLAECLDGYVRRLLVLAPFADEQRRRI